MSRIRSRKQIDAVNSGLAAFRLVLRRTADVQAEYRAATEKYLRLRSGWEDGSSTVLPSTDIDSAELSVAEAMSAAFLADFVLRRSNDGVEASRPVAVDALRLSNRVSGGLELIVGDGGQQPRRLQQAAAVLALAAFELSRSLVGYLVNHYAPDVDAGRDEHDAWLPPEQTTEVRKREAQRAVRAYAAIRRYGPGSTGGWREDARFYAQLIACVKQAVASGVPSESQVVLHEIGWLTPEELVEVRSLLQRAISEGDDDLRGQCTVGLAMLDSLDGRSEAELGMLLHAAALLSGRNRMNLLRTVLGLVETPGSLADVVRAIIATADGAGPEDGIRMRAEALPQVLIALTRIAVAEPAHIPDLARRVAGWPRELVIERHHLWLIPGVPCVAVMEAPDGSVWAEGLPGLSNPDLISRLINDHAEEFSEVLELGTLRRELSEAIEPIRTRLAEATSSVSYYAFGILKHLPLAALTGRSAVLAAKPGVLMFTPTRQQNDLISPRANPKRLFCVDMELKQSERLKHISVSEIVEFNSASTDTAGTISAISRAMSSGAREILFFCHGHVDQFRVRNSGIVAATASGGVPVVAATGFASQDLRSAELVVAMACGAGQGNVFVEPTFSIGYALRLAGAKLVIAPQWPIRADVALRFVECFFQKIDRGASYTDAWASVVGSDPNSFISIALMSG